MKTAKLYFYINKVCQFSTHSQHAGYAVTAS